MHGPDGPVPAHAQPVRPNDPDTSTPIRRENARPCHDPDSARKPRRETAHFGPRRAREALRTEQFMKNRTRSAQAGPV